MQNAENLLPYRLEIIVTDLGHWFVLLLWVLAMIGLTLYAYERKSLLGFALVLMMGLPVLGLIIRMDTMIHRMGRFLRWLGDLREAFKAADHSPNLIPYGDIYCLAIVLFMVLFAAFWCWRLWPQGRFWQAGGWLFLLLMLALYASAGSKVVEAMKLGQHPLPTTEEVQDKIPQHLP